MRAELARASAGALAGLPDVPKEIEEKTLTLAFLLARLRTYVDRDRNDECEQRRTNEPRCQHSDLPSKCRELQLDSLRAEQRAAA